MKQQRDAFWRQAGRILNSGQSRTLILSGNIHDLFYTGVSCGWEGGYQENVSRDNLIGWNHIHHIGHALLSDMGGIYTLGVQPGTVLRNDAEKWSFDHEVRPPYNIKQTAHLSPDDIREIEILLDEHPDLPADPVTPRFCGERISGLFRAQHRIGTDQLKLPVPGRAA